MAKPIVKERSSALRKGFAVWREGVGIEPTSRREPASAVLKTVRATRPVLSHVRSCTDSRTGRRCPPRRSPEGHQWRARSDLRTSLPPGHRRNASRTRHELNFVGRRNLETATVRPSSDALSFDASDGSKPQKVRRDLSQPGYGRERHNGSTTCDEEALDSRARKSASSKNHRVVRGSFTHRVRA